MRVVGSIPHQRFKIQIFLYNTKYTVKIELGQFEQTFKISQLDVMGIEDVKAMVTTEFLQGCLDRFISMREDWYNTFTNKNNINLAENMSEVTKGSLEDSSTII